MAYIELQQAHDTERSEPHGSGGCACGETNEEIPELDVQTIPHAVRHAAIFGALTALHPGFALIISATHDPVPLLLQLEQRFGDTYGATYLDRGPERWRILIRRDS